MFLWGFGTLKIGNHSGKSAFDRRATYDMSLIHTKTTRIVSFNIASATMTRSQSCHANVPGQVAYDFPVLVVRRAETTPGELCQPLVLLEIFEDFNPGLNLWTVSGLEFEVQ